MTRPLARAAAALGATLLAVTLSGCGGGDAHKPLPPVTTPATTTSTPTSRPTPSTPEWTKEYTKKQLAEYQQALSTWKAYENASASIWATGKVTPNAKHVFRRYWYAPQLLINELQAAEAVGAKVTGTTKVLSSRPTLIKPGVVRIQQCIDATHATVTIKGKVQPGAKHPFQRIVAVDRSPGAPWRILRLKDPSTRWVERCAG